ncbi:MAG: serine/threonine protein kinase [Myxococcales bacterium]|nr:serine/threonine protein kinase [Myxococcales bacterium]
MRPDHPSGKRHRLDGDDLDGSLDRESAPAYARTESIDSVDVDVDIDLVSIPSSYPNAQAHVPTVTGPAGAGRPKDPRISARQPDSLRTGPGRLVDRHAGTEMLRRPGSSPGSASGSRPDSRVGSSPPRSYSQRGSSPRSLPRILQQPSGPVDPNLGRTLGSYRIESLLGVGGMGRVYRAEHVMLGRQVALKLLRPEYAVKRDAVHRFFQEARAVNTIGHENIVDITDFVELDSGETFFIMELLQGRDLADTLKAAEQPLPLHQCMRIAMEICEGLEAAHAAGIIHRDLKPDNIFICENPGKPAKVKLLDFGVAKLGGDSALESSWQTAAGSVIGTPAYMSPEQASGIPVDNRSDIYSLGAILYELFTGHPVFRAKSFGEFVVKHMNDTPIAPRDLPDAPQIPVSLERVIMRCLEKDPEKRYQSVNDLREDLARTTATVETVINNRAETKERRSRRGLFAVVVGSGVALLAVGAFFLAAFGINSGDGSGANARGGKAGVALASGAGSASGVPTTKSLPPSSQVIKLDIRSVPTGANVIIGDSVRGTTPYLHDASEGDNITLVFAKDGYRKKTLHLIARHGMKPTRVVLEPIDDKVAPGSGSPIVSVRPGSGSAKNPDGASAGRIKRRVVRVRRRPVKRYKPRVRKKPRNKTGRNKAGSIKRNEDLDPFKE